MPQLVITKIVREFIKMETSNNGITIGQMIDNHISHRMRQGEEIQTVSFSFDPENPQDFLDYRIAMLGEPGEVREEAVAETWGGPKTRQAK